MKKNYWANQPIMKLEMENISPVTLRLMHYNDIEVAMHLKNKEGWNQTEKDWELLIESPHNICLVAEYQQKVIGTATAINYSCQVAWIGMVLVDKKYRGQGVSKLLLTDLMKKLEQCKSVKLDATPAGLPVYKKMGFVNEYSICRFTTSSLKNSFKDRYEISPELVQAKDIPEIIKFDKLIFGVERTSLINFLLKDYPDKAWLLKRNNQIAGYALGRDGTRFNQIGPVSALTTNDAKILISEALKNLTDKPVVMDIIEDKKDLSDWLNSIGFINKRPFIRMYYKDNPYPGILNRQYLISGPEFG